jgi:hypothetical protein
MKTVFWSLICSIVALGVAVFPGCGNQKPSVPKTYPVSIKVTYRGQPVAGANVTLVPQAQSGTGAAGATDATGVAKMALPGVADGAIPGKYGVTITKVESTQSDPNMSPEEFNKQQKAKSTATPSSPKHLIPVKYLSPQASRLECEVTDKADQVFEFNLAD